MKFKDIYTTLPEDINLQKFHPKIEIEVDSFHGQKKHFDISKNGKKTINAQGNKKILLKTMKKKGKHFDSLFLKKKPVLKVANSQITHKNILQQTKRPLMHTFNVTKKYFQSAKVFKIVSIFLLLFIIVLASKSLIEYNTNKGYQKILSIHEETYSDSRSETINSALTNFRIADFLFIPFRILPHTQIRNAGLVIQGGKEISTTLEKISLFGEELSQLIKEKGKQNIMYSQLILNNKKFAKDIEVDIEKIESTYSQIQFDDNSSELSMQLQEFKEKLKQIKYYLYTFNNNFDTALEILGHSKRKKYLIAFQNNDEIRPTGGFMGSLGIIEIFRGQVKAFNKNDVYWYEFKIKKEHFKRETAPEGINKLTPLLGLRDANYYINNKDSGNKIRYFMKKAGYDIDGIIYINQNTLFKVLNIIGEFHSEVLGQKVNAQNFSKIMSLLVEAKTSQKGTMGTPKQILFDFMKEFQGILNKRNINQTQLIKILLEDIQNREITLYSFHKEERKLLESVSLYNPINYSTHFDFSYPVFTSISGNKSDRYIKYSYQKNTTKGANCSFKTSLNITLEHSFGKKDEQEIRNLAKYYDIDLDGDFSDLLFIQGKGENKQYVRVILPKEAQILNKDVSIIDYQERGKSVSFYVNTPTGGEKSFTLNYNLPNTQCKIYNYKFYKQPGIKEYDIKINTFGKILNFKNNKKDISIHGTAPTKV